MIAAMILAASVHHKADAGHAAAHRAMAVATAHVGGFVTRDLEDGPTMIGTEVTAKTGALGIRMSLAGGDHVTRFAVDGIYFFCPKPVQPYAGIGAVLDCVDHSNEPRAPHAPPPPPVKRDPPSIFAGVQGRQRTTPFAELRYTFGDNDHATVSVGVRHRL